MIYFFFAAVILKANFLIQNNFITFTFRLKNLFFKLLKKLLVSKKKLIHKSWFARYNKEDLKLIKVYMARERENKKRFILPKATEKFVLIGDALEICECGIDRKTRIATPFADSFRSVME